MFVEADPKFLTLLMVCIGSSQHCQTNDIFAKELSRASHMGGSKSLAQLTNCSNENIVAQRIHACDNCATKCSESVGKGDEYTKSGANGSGERGLARRPHWDIITAHYGTSSISSCLYEGTGQ